MDVPVSARKIIEDILAEAAADLGDGYAPYRNHCFRLFLFARALGAEGDEKLAIACAFHDLAIWREGTFAYLPGSRRLAADWLQRHDRSDWAGDVDAAIDLHHKLTPCPQGQTFAEAFRRADWADVSIGLLSPGLAISMLRDAYRQFPGAGFHRLLARLILRRFRTHPLDPLPMMRL